MKKIIALILALGVLTTLLCACGAAPQTDDSDMTEAAVDQKEIVVFAAASMTETLEEIATVYMADHPEIKLTFTFDSSGTLKTQIEEGAVCDLFISAAQKQMDQLDITADEEKNPDKLDFVLSESRVNLLENKVALCVPTDNPKNINSYEDLAKALEDGNILFAMGNEDVPVGQYTQKLFDYFKLDEAALADKGVITYGTNVKEVTTQIKEGSVDAGVIYQTDAYSDSLTVVDTATEEMCGQVIYPAAVMKNSAVSSEAQAFLDYLKTDACSEIFEKVGFTPLS